MIINERTHPIQDIWLIKSFVYTILGTAILLTYFYLREKAHKRGGLAFSFFLVIVIIFSAVSFIALMLRKDRFKYELGEKNIILKQGVISKSERQVFYGRIQNIIISQDFIDKFIGIASLAIETASDSGGVLLAREAKKSRGLDFFKLGFYSNSILIPGLLYENALDLKRSIMEKIKANPIDDAQSGL